MIPPNSLISSKVEVGHDWFLDVKPSHWVTCLLWTGFGEMYDSEPQATFYKLEWQDTHWKSYQYTSLNEW